tara:strand:+ start:138 stop:344 length:207 start_codon:yes stop_codon:yes gene_type:complete
VGFGNLTIYCLESGADIGISTFEVKREFFVGVGNIRRDKSGLRYFNHLIFKWYQRPDSNRHAFKGGGF